MNNNNNSVYDISKYRVLTRGIFKGEDALSVNKTSDRGCNRCKE
jgi:hypothetical protein